MKILRIVNGRYLNSLPRDKCILASPVVSFAAFCHGYMQAFSTQIYAEVTDTELKVELSNGETVIYKPTNDE